MEKRKIDMSKYADMHSEREFTGEDGTKITVRNHIPYADKEQMAVEMAEMLLITHDESCVYTSKDFSKIEKYMIAKYYTDIDVEDVEFAEVADFMINNKLIGDVRGYIWDDYEEVEDMFWKLEESVTKTYEDDKSLKRAIRSSFGFLFTGEDVTESLAKAEGVSSTLFNALDALRNVEKEKSEKIDHGMLTVDGNVINFAKKKE